MIDVPNFEREFGRFSEIVYRRFNDGPFVSFRSGAAKGWEGYKPILRDRALAGLDATSWSDAEVGTGSILARAIEAIGIPGNDQTRNNLVSWEGRYGPGSAGHATLLAARSDPARCRALERWLMDAFRGDADYGELFERLRASSISTASRRSRRAPSTRRSAASASILRPAGAAPGTTTPRSTTRWRRCGSG